MTDTLGGGADYGFAQCVARRYGVKNETIANDEYWAWRSVGGAPPLTDQPTRNYPFFAKTIAMHDIVKKHGGTTVLSGAGPDMYLPVTPAHISDLVWRGAIREAAGELYRWTVARRSSLWRTTWSQVVRPILRPGLENWGDAGKELTGQWLTRKFWDEQQMASRLFRRPARGARGHQYENEVAWLLQLVGGALAASWNTASEVRVRHPLLHQPVVKFVLGLPYQLRTDSYCTKPLLRAAMRGVLPEEVRLRATKGTILTPQLCRAFALERGLLARLLRSPVLGDLGCIEPKRTLEAIDDAAEGRRKDVGLLFSALSLETWLAVRSGRWKLVADRTSIGCVD